MTSRPSVHLFAARAPSSFHADAPRY